ncbi:MAG: hypothetical protein QOH24_705, partial [Verrucomicrobiota bacterium]
QEDKERQVAHELTSNLESGLTRHVRFPKKCISRLLS